MRAIVCPRYGPPEVLQLREVETPSPKKTEVRIRIVATAVTASDILVRGSQLPFPLWLVLRLAVGITKPRRGIIGMVLAGDVDALGANVTQFAKGDAVYGFTGLGLGTYAEFTCVPEKPSLWGFVTAKPANMTYEEAAAVPYGGMLAMHFLKKGRIAPGQNVLIYGASGATGTAAVQLAKYFGTTVTGVCSTANIELVRSLGADHVIDYTQETSLPRGESYDLVLDAVGKRKTSALKAQSQNALTPSGTSVSVDDGSVVYAVEALVFLRELIETRQFKATIDRTYPLDQIVEAHRYVEGGHKKGNVVVTV